MTRTLARQRRMQYRAGIFEPRAELNLAFTRLALSEVTNTGRNTEVQPSAFHPER